MRRNPISIDRKMCGKKDNLLIKWSDKSETERKNRKWCQFLSSMFIIRYWDSKPIKKSHQINNFLIFFLSTETHRSTLVPERQFQKMKSSLPFQPSPSNAQHVCTTWLWKQSTTSSHRTACKSNSQPRKSHAPLKKVKFR